MQHFLPIGLAKLSHPLMVLINKSFRTLLLASGLMIVFSMQAQAQDEWTALTTIDGVEISYQKTLCNGAEIILIKTVNTNGQSTNLNLSYLLRSGDEVLGEGELGELMIDANAEVDSDCSNGLSINVFNHITTFDLEYSLEIIKSE